MILHFFLSSLSTAGLHWGAVRESSTANSCLAAATAAAAAAAGAAAAGHRVFTRPAHDAPGRRAQLASRWTDRQKKKKKNLVRPPSASHHPHQVLLHSPRLHPNLRLKPLGQQRRTNRPQQLGPPPSPPTTSGPITFSRRAGAHTCCRQDVKKLFICWLCFHDDLFGPFEILPPLKVVAKLGSSF